MIHPLEPEVLFDFVTLFPEEQIKHIQFKMFNGTATRSQEINGGDARVEREEFSISGKNMIAILRAFEMVDFNQIQKVTLNVGEDYTTTYILDALNREMTIHSLEHLDIDTIKTFKKKHSIDKVRITL